MTEVAYKVGSAAERRVADATYPLLRAQVVRHARAAVRDATREQDVVSMECGDDGSIRIARVDGRLDGVGGETVDVVSFRVAAARLPPDVIDSLAHVAAIDFRADATARGAAAIIGAVPQLPPAPGSAVAAELEGILLAQLCAVVRAAETRRLDGARPLYREARVALAASLHREGLAIDDLAAQLGASVDALSRALAAHGTSLRSLLREVRLDAIAAMLRDPDDGRPLTEIARQGGYRALPQAARSFRDRFGLTMHEYRTLTRL